MRDSDISCNPKLNNLGKGWEAARHDWILMVDSNVLMPSDHIQRMQAVWRADTGVVCSPPAGAAPGNFWAEVEAAFLNTYQARWQCFADSVGLGFAQGKSMLWRRELLDGIGGIKVLGSEVAEDAAATKIVRTLGLNVRLVNEPFIQPLGRRRAGDVWRRQVRWARLRRDTFRLFFIPELFAGAWLPFIDNAGCVGRRLSGRIRRGPAFGLVWRRSAVGLCRGLATHQALFGRVGRPRCPAAGPLGRGLGGRRFRVAWQCHDIGGTEQAVLTVMLPQQESPIAHA